MKKRIAYDYLFNYFGGDTHENNVVQGAEVCLNIRAYKDGEEVLFKDGDELKCHKYYLSDVFDVSFDRNDQFVIRRNVPVDNLFRLVYEWDRIKYEVIGYSLYVIGGTAGDIIEVSERVFRDFLKAHADDFDIRDNQSAQVPSVMFYDVPKEGDENCLPNG